MILPSEEQRTIVNRSGTISTVVSSLCHRVASSGVGGASWLCCNNNTDLAYRGRAICRDGAQGPAGNKAK